MNKTIVLGAIVFFGVMLFTSPAHAGTYLIGNPNGQGGVYATLTLDKSAYNPGENIYATGISMLSSSPIVDQVSLSGGANGSSVDLVISSISNGQSVYGGITAIGTAPATPGSHTANFTGSYNTQNIVPFSVNISEGGGAGCSSSPCITASIDLTHSISQSVTFNVSDEYWNSAVNGPEATWFSVTVPAGQTSASNWSRIYGADYSYLYPTYNTAVTVGSSGQSNSNDLPGEPLLVGSSTYLQLTAVSTGYNFTCGGGYPPQGGMACN